MLPFLTELKEVLSIVLPNLENDNCTNDDLVE
jgi:hypothetical protein